MSSNALLSLAGWYILPQLVTGYVQTILYAVFTRAGDPKPQPGSQRFARDRRWIHIGVIVVYLLYTIYDADWQLQREGDFYTLLGVGPDVQERALQSRFRRLTVQFHPDKASGSDRAAVDAIYVRLQLARDTLVDPAKRFAYDRFGSEILHWRGCHTVRDFVSTGVQRTTIFYLGSGGVLVMLGVLGYLETGRFWRYLVLVAMYVAEMHLMSRPEFPAFLTKLLNPLLTSTGLRNPYLPFQLISLARKVSVTLFIAMAQLGPLLKDPQRPLKPVDGQDSNAVPPALLDRLDALVKACHTETHRLMGLEMMPFAENPVALRGVHTAVKEWLVQNTIRNDPHVKIAIGSIVEHKRAAGEISTAS